MGQFGLGPSQLVESLFVIRPQARRLSIRPRRFFILMKKAVRLTEIEKRGRVFRVRLNNLLVKFDRFFVRLFSFSFLIESGVGHA